MNEDLWALAASRLKEKDRACVDLKPSDNINDILESLERRKQECIDKQWTVPRGRNRNAVVLRDVLTKVAVWINKFMMVGDIAVQYDPGHAALPWALIRFLLKISVQNVQEYLIIAEGVEHITLALTHYNIVERLYLKQNNESTIRLRNSLTDLYAFILKFLIRAQRFYEKNSAFPKIFSRKLSRRLDDIKEQEETVKEYIDLVDAEYRGDLERTLGNLSIVESENFRNLKDILQDLQRPLNRIEQDFRVLHDGLTIAERIRILQWISPIPYMQHHKQARKDVLAGTGTWFLKNEEVLGWLSSSSSSIMWLHGIAGSGKSKLMSIFVEEQLNDATRESNPCPIYFYCTRNPAEPERASPDTILRSLVRQLACSTSDGPILEPVRELYKSREQNGFAAGPLTLEESSGLIIQLSQDRPLTTIVIDALDECDLSSRGDLLDALSRILQDSCGLVKILISSRADADIFCHFSECLSLRIEASQNQDDIEHYIDFEVEDLIKRKKLLYGNVSKGLKQTIQTVLREQAQGMFRWVSLQLQYICALRIEVSIRKRLGELPVTLCDLYQETYVKQLGAHKEEERLIAETILRLLMCLREPLTTRNFLLALELCGEERTPLFIETVLYLCANFVVLDTELDVFRFAHLSVREFLEKKEGFDAASNHAIAAECCLRCLLNVKPRYEVRIEDGWITEDNGGRNGQRRAAFQNLCHEYSCLYWLFHLNESSAHRQRPPLKTLFWKFMLHDQNSVPRQCAYWIELNDVDCHQLILDGWRNKEYRMKSMEVRGLNDNVCKFACLVVVASAWNFCDVLQYCISMDPHVVRLGHSKGYTTPLHIACRYGNVDAAELLVDNGSDMEEVSLGQRTPIREALDWGYLNMMVIRLLFDKGANPNSKPEYFHDTDIRHETYLRKAARCGVIDLVKALLDAGADLDQTGEYAETALDVAMHNGNIAMVRMMLESSGRTNEITNIPWIKATQLIRAVLNGDEVDVGATLREWPIAKISAQYLNVALWSAARFDKGNCMRLLVEEGADINFQHHGTPVLFAAAMSTSTYGLDERNCPLVQFLLRQGADPNVIGSDETLLHWTIRCKEFSLARILLEEGADINQGGPASPPLVYVACYGKLDAARFLLQRGADIERKGDLAPLIKGKASHSALYWARNDKRPNMVQLLLQHGAKDEPGSCPHHDKPGPCPYDHGPEFYLNELGQVTDATHETEAFKLEETPNDEALGVN